MWFADKKTRIEKQHPPPPPPRLALLGGARKSTYSRQRYCSMHGNQTKMQRCQARDKRVQTTHSVATKATQSASFFLVKQPSTAYIVLHFRQNLSTNANNVKVERKTWKDKKNKDQRLYTSTRRKDHLQMGQIYQRDQIYQIDQMDQIDLIYRRDQVDPIDRIDQMYIR